jgi:serine/threonine protein kinase
LLDAIGVGGMAAVLRARDTQLDRTVALKILPLEMANDPENVRRFHQEARSAAKLDHENIARVFFCGKDQRLHFIAFEFVEGDNLRTILERRGRLPAGEALHYLLQVAAGLAHAAARGVVHRDIKPSNIIVTPSGRAKLVDMGLARSLERHDQELTQSGVTLGTFDYISPEQALEPRDADVRSDIYSLGCTFYHLLTGQPPVPEGTAAKKLHHHQHVKPTDPRELAPGIPDNVAMILARMMAKDPRDRYQTPEHLFHDLLLAVRKLGTGGDVPEGVLAVEASLPQPPSYRPMLLVALAAAAVVALILVLAPVATSPPGRHGPGPQSHNDKDSPTPLPKDGGPKEVVKDSPKDPVQPAVAKYDADDVTGDRLASWLGKHENADRIEIELARDIDLPVRDGSEPRLVVKANKVFIRSKNPKRRATIRLSYSLGTAASRAALTIDSKDASVKNVRVLLDGGNSEGSMTGLLLEGGGRYTVECCEFLQARSSFDEHQRLASVVLASAPAPGGDAARAVLVLSECTFLGFDQLQTDLEGTSPVKLLLTGADHGGQDAVVRRGPGLLTVSDCAFGPHAADFRFEGGAGDRDTALVRHCSVMAGRGSTAFYFADDAAALLDVHCSLFSRPGEADSAAAEKDASYLIRQAGRAAVVYRGLDNRYHNLNGYWLGGEHEEMTFPAFRDKLNEVRVGDTSGKEDKSSRVLPASPWKEKQPLAAFPPALAPDKPGYSIQFVDATRKPPDDGPAKPADEDQLSAVFQVKPDQPDLRTTDAPDKGLIGVEHLGGVRYAAKLPPLDKAPEPTMRRTLVVDPTVEMSKNLTYPSLRQAVGEAKPGDLILIRHTGELKVKPIQLEEPTSDVTIRPAEDQRPVLVIGATPDPEASMFRVHDGKLHLEGLEFRLQPADKFHSQAVATLVGDGQCTFKDCVVTLDPAGQETALAVAALADSAAAMKMKGQPPGPVSASPRLAFDNCFVRGKGDLIWGRGSRPFDLDLKNSLVALDGNLLNVEAAENAAAVMSMPNVNATLGHTTAYLSGYAVRLKAGKDLKALVPVQFTAVQSLFVASAAQAFIHLDGPEMNQEQLRTKLSWMGEQNAFAGWGEMMIDHRPSGEDARPLTMTQDRWKTFAGDAGSSKFYQRVKFTPPGDTPLPGDTPFARLVPGQFKPADLTGVGADVQQTPRPSGDAR